MARSSKAASGPRMTLTLSRSISSWALVLAPAGLPPVSAETSSTLRPPRLLFFSFRKTAMPCSIWIPPWASGPVLTVSKPILNAAPCAIAGMPMAAAAVPAAVPARNLRRLKVIDMAVLLVHPFSGCSSRRPRHEGGPGALALTPSSAKVFHDVKPSIVIRAIDNPIAVDEYIRGLNDAGAVGTMVDQAPRRGRHQRADLDRAVLVADVEDPHARILIGRENELRAHEAAGAVLVDIVRTEMRALGLVVCFGRGREGRDAHGVAGRADVEQPDELEPVLLMIEHRLVEHHQQVAIGQRQAIMGASPEGRAPVAVRDQLRRAAVGDVDHDQPAVAPGPIDGVAVNDRVMQPVTPGRRP